ncbi:MAG: SpoIIE family protein phosphatase [Acidimicrobiia bacterium]
MTYGLGSKLALLLIEASGLQGVFFIPSGITVAFLLRLRRGLWWIVLLGAGLTEFVMDAADGFSTTQALGFSTANVVEPLVGALIVSKMCPILDLARRRHLFWYTVGAVVVGTAAGAAIGAGSDRLFGGDDFVVTFAQWWLGDALGVILVGSAILVWGSSPDRRAMLSPPGVALVVGSVVVTIVVVTYSDLPLIFAVLVGVVLAGALFGIRAAAMTSLAVALTLAVLIALQPGPLIAGLSPASALVLVKLQLGTFAMAGLLVAAESNERQIATERLVLAEANAVASERERQRQHELAVHIQKGLLPDSLYQPPGFEVAARYEAASEAFEVGGDWYDAFELSGGRVGLVIGDIVGHGIDAMTSMGRLRTAVSALARNNDGPAPTLTAVDEFAATPDGTGYATVFYAVVDPAKANIQYASAGHPPALLVSVDGAGKWLDAAQSHPLSGNIPGERGQADTAFPPGATLILYSDGLVERRGESLAEGLERLESLACSLARKRPLDICERLFADLGGRAREDDVVVMVMRSQEVASDGFYERFPARPEELSNARSSIRSWMDGRELSAAVKDDLLIALGEVTANAVRHAYHDVPAGIVEISVQHLSGRLVAEVSDDGTWLEGGEADTPGLGLGIVGSITEDLRIDSTGSGTLVTFVVPIPGAG